MFAFVRPPAPFNRYIQNVPLNYIHLAGWLRKAGREVHILDMVIDGVTPDSVDQFIREHGIRVVGIGCMTCEFPAAVDEARRLKSRTPASRSSSEAPIPPAIRKNACAPAWSITWSWAKARSHSPRCLNDLEAGRAPGWTFRRLVDARRSRPSRSSLGPGA